jgi:IS5 family transposase
MPDSFKENAAKLRQKDTDARWTKKNNETHSGYKNHVNADNSNTDNGNKIIRDYEVTSAVVHDSNVLDDILTENTSKDVYADSAYRSKGQKRGWKNLDTEAG